LTNLAILKPGERKNGGKQCEKNTLGVTNAQKPPKNAQNAHGNDLWLLKGTLCTLFVCFFAFLCDFMLL
jgi:hypothetical protein